MIEIQQIRDELARIEEQLAKARAALEGDDWVEVIDRAGDIVEAGERVLRAANVVGREMDLLERDLEVEAPALTVQPDTVCSFCGGGPVLANLYAWRCERCGHGSGTARAS